MRECRQLLEDRSLPIGIKGGESARQRAAASSPAHREGDAAVPRPGRICGRPLQLVSEPQRMRLRQQIEQQMIIDDERHEALLSGDLGIAGDDVHHDSFVLAAGVPGGNDLALGGVER